MTPVDDALAPAAPAQQVTTCNLQSSAQEALATNRVAARNADTAEVITSEDASPALPTTVTGTALTESSVDPDDPDRTVIQILLNMIVTRRRQSVETVVVDGSGDAPADPESTHPPTGPFPPSGDSGSRDPNPGDPAPDPPGDLTPDLPSDSAANPPGDPAPEPGPEPSYPHYPDKIEEEMGAEQEDNEEEANIEDQGSEEQEEDPPTTDRAEQYAERRRQQKRMCAQNNRRRKSNHAWFQECNLKVASSEAAELPTTLQILKATSLDPLIFVGQLLPSRDAALLRMAEVSERDGKVP
ncbi:hypothetical protein CYMTET_13732 [Cymbomonas tetramitiformis]|uniref:Uncharacterized protein n=1 Tax=Cymbomonas tetramitiformis TaxID=36881 RepID=A0AAE0LAK9_9CHLO|nr:hypothetical protein CYMTET_13732 [Cymbomonas tetramitiformis]